MAERFKPGVYLRNGKPVFLNDKGKIENPRLYYMRTNSLDMYESYVKPILQFDYPSVLEPVKRFAGAVGERTAAVVESIKDVELEDITSALSITISAERQRKEIEDKKKKFDHPDAVKRFGKNMTYYQYEQAVKEEEEAKEEMINVNKAFTERTGIVIPESYK